MVLQVRFCRGSRHISLREFSNFRYQISGPPGESDDTVTVLPVGFHRAQYVTRGSIVYNLHPGTSLCVKVFHVLTVRRWHMPVCCWVWHDWNLSETSLWFRCGTSVTQGKTLVLNESKTEYLMKRKKAHPPPATTFTSLRHCCYCMWIWTLSRYYCNWWTLNFYAANSCTI